MTPRAQWPAVRRALSSLARLPHDLPLGPLHEHDGYRIGAVWEFRDRLLLGEVSTDEIALLLYAYEVRQRRATRRGQSEPGPHAKDGPC